MTTRNSCTSLFFIVFVVSLCTAQGAHSETAPCALLIQNQVTTIVGASVGGGSPIANTGCSWTTTGAPRVTVTVSMQSEKMFVAAKQSAPAKTTKTPISGVGDEAIFTCKPSSPEEVTLLVRSHFNAMAAYEQGNDKFWAMHDRFFEKQNQLSPAYYEQVAREIGLDLIALLSIGGALRRSSRPLPQPLELAGLGEDEQRQDRHSDDGGEACDRSYLRERVGERKRERQ